MDWFLYDNSLRHERVKSNKNTSQQLVSCSKAYLTLRENCPKTEFFLVRILNKDMKLFYKTPVNTTLVIRTIDSVHGYNQEDKFQFFQLFGNFPFFSTLNTHFYKKNCSKKISLKNPKIIGEC